MAVKPIGGPIGGRMKRGVPVLASLDIDRTLAFYSGKLGFEVVAAFHNYGIVTRDDVEIHFWLCQSRAIAEATSGYFYVSGVDALYKAMKRTGVRMTPPHDQPYGMREFHVWDADGNLLKFGEEIPAMADVPAKQTA